MVRKAWLCWLVLAQLALAGCSRPGPVVEPPVVPQEHRSAVVVSSPEVLYVEAVTRHEHLVRLGPAQNEPALGRLLLALSRAPLRETPHAGQPVETLIAMRLTDGRSLLLQHRSAAQVEVSLGDLRAMAESTDLVSAMRELPQSPPGATEGPAVTGLPAPETLVSEATLMEAVAWDGLVHLIYRSGERVLIQPMDGSRPRELRQVFPVPEGRIGAVSARPGGARELLVVLVGEGAELYLVTPGSAERLDSPLLFPQATWLGGDPLVTKEDGFWRFDRGTREWTHLMPYLGLGMAAWGAPNSERFIYTFGIADGTGLWAFDVRGEQYRHLYGLTGVRSFTWLSDDHAIYLWDHGLGCLTFDPGQPVLRHLDLPEPDPIYSPRFAGGWLVYRAGTAVRGVRFDPGRDC